MNNRQNGRRRRGGGGNTPRPMGMAQGNQGGNRLEIRVRGNAHQLLEKYKVLARDAHQAGDRVAAEYYLQHADHYFRVLNDSRIRQEEMRARRGIFDPLDDEADDEDQLVDLPEPSGAGERGAAEDEGFRSHGPRDEGRRSRERDSRRQEERQGRAPRGGQAEQGRASDRDLRMPGEAGDGGEPQDASAPPTASADRAGSRDMPGPISDGEAALVAFGGAPADRAVAAGGEARDEDAPAPRRRTRVRRAAPAPAEG